MVTSASLSRWSSGFDARQNRCTLDFRESLWKFHGPEWVLPYRIGSVWWSAWFGTMRPQVRILYPVLALHGSSWKGTVQFAKSGM